eukprot:6491583-Amphidinium_carterae.1
MAAMALLDVAKHWHMSVYQLETTMRPLMFLYPSIVSVVPFAACESSYSVWPVLRRKHARPLKTKTAKKKRTLDPLATLDADVDCMDNWSEEDVLEDDEHVPSDSGSEGGSDEQDNEGPASTLEALLSTTGALDHLSVTNLAFIADAASRVETPEPIPIPQEGKEVVTTLTSGHGGASSSTQPPPLVSASIGVAATVTSPARVGAARGSKIAAGLTVQTPYGTIAYYEKGDFFEAVCKHAGHGQCKMRRSCKGSARAKHPGGRPLGFLMCWLYSSGLHSTKEEHWDKTCWAWSHEERADHRAMLSTLELGLELHALERDRLDDEGSEPDSITPYLRTWCGQTQVA